MKSATMHRNFDLKDHPWIQKRPIFTEIGVYHDLKSSKLNSIIRADSILEQCYIGDVILVNGVIINSTINDLDSEILLGHQLPHPGQHHQEFPN
jgi:hypothetical protein